MRIVVATVGSLGDLHPMLALGLALQARGHRVAIATSEYYRDKIVETGLGFHPARPDLRPDDKDLIRAAMDERRGPEEVVRFMLRALPETYADYERAVSADGGADLIVTSDLAYAGVILAAKVRLRWASQVLAPLTFLSAYDPSVLPPVPWLSRLSVLGPAIYGAILRAGKRRARPLAEPIFALRRRLGLPEGRDPFFDEKNAPALVLAMFSPLLGQPRPDWPRSAVVTGFAFYDRHNRQETLSPDLERFLDAGDPPIVFTLGSSAVFDAGRFYVESARAAEMVGRRAVLLVGPEPGPLPPPRPGLGVFDYAPFSKLFPRAALVVHHGGAGTTAQAMRAGRPMLVVPFSHDQPDNALRVERLGIARSVRRSRYSAERVASALRPLLTDTSLRQRAAHVGRLVSEEDGAAVAADAIEKRFGSMLG